MSHAPVMLSECMEQLEVKPGAWYVDGTFGAGGHTRAILAAGGRVLGIDRDASVARFFDEDVQADGTFRFTLGNFSDVEAHASAAGISPVAGVLLDLGVSSMQLDEAQRGFSFRQPGPLDMRMGGAGPSAAELVNSASQEELAEILFRYGEERHSRRIARRIVEARAEAPITTTDALAEIVRRAYPPGYRREHSSRRTFQALRVAVNDELGALEAALAGAERALASQGRLVVLSYHSLEDRIVKRFIKGSAALLPLHKKPLTASAAEIATNPRARSAKLRAAVKEPAQPPPEPPREDA